MRTTITLDRDVSQKVAQRIRLSGKKAKAVYNELLREALTAKRGPGKADKPFQLIVFKGKKGLRSGFNWNMTHAEMIDRLDEEEFKKPR